MIGVSQIADGQIQGPACTPSAQVADGQMGCMRVPEVTQISKLTFVRVPCTAQPD